MSITAEVTFGQAAATGAETVEAARGILRRAKDCPWPDEDYPARKTIQAAAWHLAEALAAYERLRLGLDAPGEAFPGLGPGPEAYGVALGAAAEDAEKDAAVVVEVIRETCGDETAAFVRGSEGEQS